MSDIVAEQNPTQAPRSRARFWQIGLRTLILLMSAVAVWTVVYAQRRQNALLQTRLAVIRPLAHDLVVHDKHQIAAVKLDEFWYDEKGWAIYLPEGKYRLCLATNGIDDGPVAPSKAVVPLGPGRHTIVVEQNRLRAGWQVLVLVDDQIEMNIDEPLEWCESLGDTTNGDLSTSTQSPANKPVKLFHRRFIRHVGGGTHKVPGGPSEGLLLWVEPIVE